MPAHTAQHTEARMRSIFGTMVERAEADIMHELGDPRRTSLTINSDRKARWAAVQKLIALRRVVVVIPEARRLTRRPPPGGGPLRERLEVRIRKIGPGDEV